MQVFEHHAAVDRHIVDALLGLVLDHVQKMLRPHLLDLAAQLFEHLVDGHGADRHGRSADDGRPNLVDMLAGREVHHRVGPEVDGVVQLVDLAFEAASDGRVADVGVHLAAGRDADAHRLQPAGQMHLIGRNHHSPGGHFAANEFRLKILALGDKFHLGRRMPGAGIF